MVKNFISRVDPSSLSRKDKVKYNALNTKDTSKTDNTIMNRNFERAVYAAFSAQSANRSLGKTVSTTVRTAWATKDSDGDGAPDINDDFRFDATERKDTDGDGVGDNSDKFPNDNRYQADLDNDNIPDKIDPDRDGDNVLNVDDVYPDDGNEWADTDLSLIHI